MNKFGLNYMINHEDGKKKENQQSKKVADIHRSYEMEHVCSFRDSQRNFIGLIIFWKAFENSSSIKFGLNGYRKNQKRNRKVKLMLTNLVPSSAS